MDSSTIGCTVQYTRHLHPSAALLHQENTNLFSPLRIRSAVSAGRPKFWNQEENPPVSSLGENAKGRGFNLLIYLCKRTKRQEVRGNGTAACCWVLGQYSPASGERRRGSRCGGGGGGGGGREARDPGRQAAPAPGGAGSRRAWRRSACRRGS